MISIHALREEGDFPAARSSRPPANFYPRPPRGGRLLQAGGEISTVKFLSTPSARRATLDEHDTTVIQQISIHALREEGDLGTGGPLLRVVISIHALREEGDLHHEGGEHHQQKFLSTPSARRAT